MAALRHAGTLAVPTRPGPQGERSRRRSPRGSRQDGTLVPGRRDPRAVILARVSTTARPDPRRPRCACTRPARSRRARLRWPPRSCSTSRPPLPSGDRVDGRAALSTGVARLVLALAGGRRGPARAPAAPVGGCWRGSASSGPSTALLSGGRLRLRARPARHRRRVLVRGPLRRRPAARACRCCWCSTPPGTLLAGRWRDAQRSPCCWRRSPLPLDAAARARRRGLRHAGAGRLDRAGRRLPLSGRASRRPLLAGRAGAHPRVDRRAGRAAVASGTAGPTASSAPSCAGCCGPGSCACCWSVAGATLASAGSSPPSCSTSR